MRWFLGSSFLFALTSAGDISLLLFSDAQCTGDIVTNVHSNPANANAASGCIATNFQSAGAATVDSGFQCNVYADTACQNFLTTIKSTDQCETLIGKGAICFSQASFENPLTGVTAKVTIGNSVVHFTAEVRSFEMTDNALRGACGANGCDPNSPFNKDLKLFPGKKKCTVTSTARGNYDNTAVRDYMIQLISDVALKQSTIDFAGVDGFGNPNSAASTMPGFIQVVLNDATGNNKAQMEVSTSASCEGASTNGCDSFVADRIKDGLKAVPAVGGLLATGFDAVCNVGS